MTAEWMSQIYTTRVIREPGLFSLPEKPLNISFIVMDGKYKAECVFHSRSMSTKTPLELQYCGLVLLSDVVMF